MALSKLFSAEDGPFRKMKGWVSTPFKRSAGQLKDWMDSFKCSTETGRCRKLKDLPMMVSLQVRSERWRCKVGTDDVPDVFRSKKWSRNVVHGVVILTCCILAFRFKICLAEGGILMTVMAFSSMIPKSKAESAESADVVDVLSLEEKSGSDDEPDSNDEPGSDDKVISDDKLDFGGFPSEIQGRVLGYLPYEQVFQLKNISKVVKTLAESDEFQASPSRKKPTLTACHFFIDNGVWNWAGFDASTQVWRLLPPLTFLPDNCKPDPDLFKEFLICAKDGLVCINFSKSADRERLIVFNPLSKVWKELPPLNHRRNPVLMHMLVDPVTQAYQVIVAGSSKSGDENLSQITEVFDSCTGIWKRTGDILGPLYALNEFQSGVHQDGKLFCIGFVEENDQVGKGIIAYDVQECKWSSIWMHLLPFCMSSTILQLVESSGEVFLFSEREIGRSTEHWVDKLEWTDSANGDDTKNICQLINVIQKKKTGGRSLEVYPEYVCVPYAEGQLCIVNAIDHTGVVYDIQDQEQSEFVLEAPGEGFRGERGFFSLNPMSFTIEPRFSSKVKQRLEGLRSQVIATK